MMYTHTLCRYIHTQYERLLKTHALYACVFKKKDVCRFDLTSKMCTDICRGR